MALTLNGKFAANIKKRRVAKKLTQEALGHKVGITVSYVSMLERGKRNPPLDTVEKFAKALGVPPVALLG